MTGTALGTTLAESLDPVLLARRTGMEPDDWQSRLLRSTDRRIVLNCSRQAGKSSVVAILAMHRALHFPGSTVLVFAPSQRQAVRLFRNCLTIYRQLGRPVQAESENVLSLVLENGSQVHALPADAGTVRGYAAVDLLVVDEAGWVGDSLWDAVTPMLAVSGGRAVIMSTPNGRRGFFYEAATGDDPRWTRYTVTADQCPRITPGFLAEEREAKGAHVFEQEYMCRFVDGTGSLFDGEDLAVIVRPDVEPLDWDEPVGGALRVVTS